MRIVINTVIHHHHQSRPGYKQANQMNSDHDSRVHPNRNVRITSDPQIFQPKERTIVIPTISNSVRTVSLSFHISKYLQCLSLKKVQVETIFFVAFKILTRSIQEVDGRTFSIPLFCQWPFRILLTLERQIVSSQESQGFFFIRA